MAESSEDRLKDVATLTRAVESTFRRVMRFLVGRISLVRLQEMIRSIFVEEAEFLLRSRNEDRSMSLSELALVTGLDTRTISKVRNDKNYQKPFSESDAFLVDLNPGSSVIDIWSTEEPYFDSKNGKPRVLDLTGSRLSFEALFNDNISARGVTAMSLLARLAQSGSVEVDETQSKVRLLKYTYFPIDIADQVGAIEMGFSAVGDLLETLHHNLTLASNMSERRFQRGTWSARLSKSQISDAKAELSRLLQWTDDEARRIVMKYEISDSDLEYVRAGVGYYYFEGPSSARKKVNGEERIESAAEHAD